MGVKKTITTETVTGEEADKGEGTQPEELDEDTIRALVDIEGSNEVSWQIHRLSEPNSGYCGEMSTPELSHERIASAYGPGLYRVKGVRPDGKYFKSGRVKISSVPRKQEMTIDEIKKQLGNGNSDANMMSLLLAMMNSNTSIITAAFSKPQPSINWSAILVAAPALLTAAKSFFKNDSDGESMERILKQLTILDKLRGDDHEKTGSTWMDIVRDALPGLRAMVPVPKSAPHPVPVRTVADSSTSVHSVSDAPIPLPETPVAVEPTPEIIMMEWLRKKLEELIQCAAQNKNPELRAEVFIDDLPPFLPEKLIHNMLARDDWFEQLKQFDSRVANYFGWFNELRECILDTLEENEATNERVHPGRVATATEELGTERDSATSNASANDDQSANT